MRAKYTGIKKEKEKSLTLFILNEVDKFFTKKPIKKALYIGLICARLKRKITKNKALMLRIIKSSCLILNLN